MSRHEGTSLLIDCELIVSFSHVAVCSKSIMTLSCTLKDKSEFSPGNSYFFTDFMKRFSKCKYPDVENVQSHKLVGGHSTKIIVESRKTYHSLPPHPGPDLS